MRHALLIPEVGWETVDEEKLVVVEVKLVVLVEFEIIGIDLEGVKVVAVVDLIVVVARASVIRSV